MIITVLNRTNQDMSAFSEDFEVISRRCEKILNLKEDNEVSVSFVRSRTIHQLNRDYRKIDRPTDVITFAAMDGEEIYPEEEQQDLGDIFINIDYARRQAREYGHSFRREICFLFTHGLLHCLGYDHMTPEEEKEMFSLQDEILDEIVQRI